MWFKQFSWYNMQSPLLLEGEALDSALSEKQAYPPHATQSKSIGWISPLGEGQPLSVTAGEHLWLAVKMSTKLLPAGVIKDALAEKLAEQEQLQGYPPTNKQKRVMRDELTLELLPKAFVQSKRVNVVIDPQTQVLLIDSTSATVKDAVVDLLRQTVGSCPLTHHIEQKSAIGQVLKQWVTDAPDNVSVQPECTLINPNDIHAKARMAGIDEAMITSHIAQGMSVSQLVVEYAGQIRFQINDQLDFSKIKYMDMEEGEKLEDPILQATTDFALTVPYFLQLIAACKQWFPLEETTPQPQEVVDVVE